MPRLFGPSASARRELKNTDATIHHALNAEIQRRFANAEKRLEHFTSYADTIKNIPEVDRLTLEGEIKVKERLEKKANSALEAISEALSRYNSENFYSEYKDYLCKIDMLRSNLATLKVFCNNFLEEKLRLLEEKKKAIRRINAEIEAVAKSPDERRQLLGDIALSFGFELVASPKKTVSPPPIVGEKTALPLPERAPALWAERTTGREVTPVDFIKQHYGLWIGRGLSRTDIKRLDEKLYDAYCSWIRPSRHPQDVLIELDMAPRVPHNRIDDPVEAIERYRQRQRKANAKHRAL